MMKKVKKKKKNCLVHCSWFTRLSVISGLDDMPISVWQNNKNNNNYNNINQDFKNSRKKERRNE